MAATKTSALFTQCL